LQSSPYAIPQVTKLLAVLCATVQCEPQYS